MTFAPHAGAGPIIRLVAGVISTVVLLIALALPAAADGGGVQLSHASVSQRVGTTATIFTFKVTYRNRAGSPPDHVQVVVDGTAHVMVAEGDRWKKGVTFSVRTTLPAGEHAVRFVAVNEDGRADETFRGKITVGPAAAQKPVPKPTPAPARTAAPKPRTTPTPAKSAAPKPRVTPTLPAVVVVPTPKAEPSPAAAAPGDPVPPTDAAPPVRPVPDGPAAPDGRGTHEATAGLPGSWGELTRYVQALGLDPAGSPLLRLLPVMIWTTGGVALVMAFGFFGKRRRDGEPPEPDEVLAARAARGIGEVVTAALVPVVALPAAPIDAELAMPRWRRPSLLQARKADPLRSGASMSRMSFEHAAVAPIDGYERRLIRYMVVQLLDTPDEFRGISVGSLAQGDEVQLLEQSGTYWRVLCPDGQQGWIHRMTLGDTVGLPASPSARETWATASLEADAVDEDVLVAFMTARGRA